jgi:UDP-glucose 4-epimerase
MRVLVTGGAGYIGSHTLVELLERGHEVTCVDNYSNGAPEALRRVGELVPHGALQAFELDIRDEAALGRVVAEVRPEAVIHFAGLKAVGESGEKPLDYYDVNVSGTLSLLRAMETVGCGRIIFSSSATVYGEPQALPCTEDHPLAPTNVYGWTKRIAEQVLGDWARANAAASVVLLRYFNPVGAHPSGRIGEDPAGIPNNLMPYIAQVAAGRLERLRIFGDDYPTPDGTGVRDYIHVVDLARAHIAALEHSVGTTGTQAFNIGTGQGYSVREMLQAFCEAAGRDLPYEIAPRRSGDIAAIHADPARATQALGWQAEHGLREMVESHWAWQSRNPNGYRD